MMYVTKKDLFSLIIYSLCLFHNFFYDLYLKYMYNIETLC